MSTFDIFSRKVGLRYLTAKKGSSVLSIVSVMSVSGVAVGVFAMVVILSVMSGFENEMKKRLFQAETHMRIEKKEIPWVFQEKDLLQSLPAEYKEIRFIGASLQTEVIFKTAKRVSGAVLKGVDEKGYDRMKPFVNEWISSQHKQEGVAPLLLGEELAFELGVIPGDILTVVSPIEMDGPMGLAPRMKKFQIEGLYKTGVPEQELHVAMTHLNDVESFLKKAGVISAIEVQLGKLEDSPVLSKKIKMKLGDGYEVRSWQELNAHLMSALRLERIAMFCMLTFIVLVATFNILSVLTMTVLEKKKSVSVLRAMGARRSQVLRIFLWQASFIALIGTAAGVGSGLLVCFFLKRYPLIELPEYFYDRTVPVLIQYGTISLVVLLTFCIVIVGALYPSWRASKLTPLEGIRSAS